MKAFMAQNLTDPANRTQGNHMYKAEKSEKNRRSKNKNDLQMNSLFTLFIRAAV